MRDGDDTGTIKRGNIKIVVVIAARYAVVAVSYKSIK